MKFSFKLIFFVSLNVFSSTNGLMPNIGAILTDNYQLTTIISFHETI